MRSRAIIIIAAVALAVRPVLSILSVSVKNCEGLVDAIPRPMSQDVRLSLHGTGSIICDAMSTITVQGPHRLYVTSSTSSLRLSGIRFDVSDGAHVSWDAGGEGTHVSTTFVGATSQDSDGGVFGVSQGSSVIFRSPVTFEYNAVSAGHSGGAVWAAGMITFEEAAHFASNRVWNDSPPLRDADLLSSGFDHLGCGGAVAVDTAGEVVFAGMTMFEENAALSGGEGGAVCNKGSVAFLRRSFFVGNIAQDYYVETKRGTTAWRGGAGGALFTAAHAGTVFNRRATLYGNFADRRGGAVCNEGTTSFYAAAYLQGNDVTGDDRVWGGHVFNSGELTVQGDASFREGSKQSNGSPIYTTPAGKTVLLGIVTVEDHAAVGTMPAVVPKR